MPFRLAPQLLYAGLLCLAAGRGGHLLALTAAVLVLDLAVHLLPWRLPRADRSVLGYWGESLAYVVPLGAVAGVWLVAAPDRSGATLPAGTSSLAVWLLVAVAVGIALAGLSGTNLRALRTGDLAFLAGPLRPNQAAARIVSVLAAPFLEETVFRGVPAGLPGWYAIAGLLLGGTAFVCRHHLVKGWESRDRWIVVRHELLAAVLLTGLVVGSGSVWPAIVAHLLANLPGVVLDGQRADRRVGRPADKRSDEESDVPW